MFTFLVYIYLFIFTKNDLLHLVGYYCMMMTFLMSRVES